MGFYSRGLTRVSHRPSAAPSDFWRLPGVAWTWILLHLFWGLFASLIQPSRAQAKIFYLLDFDGTIVSEAADSTWRTSWILKRVDHLHNLVQNHPHRPTKVKFKNLAGQMEEMEITPPERFPVSYFEFRKLLPELAKGEGQLGGFSAVELEPDPLLPDQRRIIIPGFYRVSDDVSFERFRPAPEGSNFLLEDYENARRRSEVGRGRRGWKGPAFPLLEAALSSPETVRNLAIFSARYQRPDEVDSLFGAWQRHGEVKHIEQRLEDGRVLKPRFHSLHEPSSLKFGRHLGEKKVQAVAAEAQQLLVSPAPRHRELVSHAAGAEAGEIQAFHTLIVAENDPRYVRSVGRLLAELSADHRYTTQIKFVLFNAGSSEDVNGAEWKYPWVVFDKGFARPALVEEIQLWTAGRDRKFCQALLEGGGE